MQFILKTICIGLMTASLLLWNQVALAKKIKDVDKEEMPKEVITHHVIFIGGTPAQRQAVGQQLQQIWGQQPQQQMWGPQQQIWGQQLYFRAGCHRCHGLDAKTPNVQGYPKLTGQNREYLINQMRSIQYGMRTNNLSRIMAHHISGLSDNQMQAIVAWLTSQKW